MTTPHAPLIAAAKSKLRRRHQHLGAVEREQVEFAKLRKRHPGNWRQEGEFWYLDPAALPQTEAEATRTYVVLLLTLPSDNRLFIQAVNLGFLREIPYAWRLACLEAYADALAAKDRQTYTRPVERGEDWPEAVLAIYTKPQDPQGREGRLYIRRTGCGHEEQVLLQDGGAVSAFGTLKCAACGRAGG